MHSIYIVDHFLDPDLLTWTNGIYAPFPYSHTVFYWLLQISLNARCTHFSITGPLIHIFLFPHNYLLNLVANQLHSPLSGPCEVFYQRDPFIKWEKRMPSDRRFLCRYIVQEKTSLTSGTRVANLTPLSLTKKRHLDSRVFGPQAQVLPSDAATPLPASIRVSPCFGVV